MDSASPNHNAMGSSAPTNGSGSFSTPTAPVPSSVGSPSMEFPSMERISIIAQLASMVWASDPRVGPSVPAGWHSPALIQAYLEVLDQLIFASSSLRGLLLSEHANCCDAQPSS
ncbi:hypothetical protein NMY22_g16450 [Coprinellus aureogranulatus]|nr:hypothetical protein NMY22_g16450 [Coprinellus aureogranulatus]